MPSKASTAQKERDRIAELIHRRRRQILVHSILYYSMDTTLVTDAVFNEWARELTRLQEDNPDIALAVPYHRNHFIGFQGTTGFYLPLDDPRAIQVARRLLDYARTHPEAGAEPVGPAEEQPLTS